MSGHSERAHSPLGASGAYRWMECPASRRMTEHLPNQSTVFAAEGTAAHELAERCLRDGSQAADHEGERLTVGNHVFYVDQDMAEAVQEYLDTVRGDVEEGDRLLIEERFHLSSIHEDLWGTNDAAVWKQDGRVIVYDYKHGKGIPVSPVGNPQLIYYALGLLSSDMFRGQPVTSVELVIVQPRAGKGVQRWEVDVMELLSFSGDLRKAALATEDPDAPMKAGDWCRFCSASGTCPALAETAMEAAEYEFDTPVSSLDSAKLGRIVEQAELIQHWVKSVKAEMAFRMASGEHVAGWKFVLGRAGNRKWADPDGAEALMRAEGFDEDEIFEAPKIKSPTQLEKLLPKSERGVLAPFVTRSEPKPSIVHESDARPAVAPPASAEEDFAFD